VSTCPSCGAQEPSRSPFCTACGQELSAAGESTGAAQTQREKAAAERRLLTVLMCDLVASTPLSESLDPEDLSGVMSRYVEIVNGVIRRFGGHISQWAGDGVVVYFGFPRAREDDAERAVRCGMEIVAAIEAAGAELEREHGVALAVRVGINSGTTVVGGEAADSHGGTLAYGDAPNIAARIQSACAPGTVAVGERTHRLIAGSFAFRALGPHSLKGVAEPVELYRPVASREEVGRFEARAVRGLAPLVGRSAERTVLRGACERAAGGEVAAVLVSGEPGIGKSRLARAAVATAEESMGMQSIVCECSPFHQGDPLYPLLDGLRRRWMADIEGLAERLGAIALTDRQTALLIRALGAPVRDADASLETMSSQRERHELLDAVADALHADARRAPLLVVVEDLHWVDPTTLEVLGTLIGGRDGGLALLLTARPEFVPPWTELERLDVGPLDESETLELVRDVAGETASEVLVRRMAERAEGVPLFAEELARAVPATGIDDEGDIPNSLYSCLMARLDRDPVAHSVAQLAATIGRRFELPLLSALGELDPPTLREGLEQLLADELICREGEDRCAFRHTLIQEAARGSLLRETRRAYSGRIARTLLERFPDLARAQPERVARHFEGAGELAEAIAQWQQAGVLALEHSAHQEASGHFERALTLAARLPDSANRSRLELELHVLAAIPLVVTQGWTAPALLDHYRRAEELCADVEGAPQLFPTMQGLVAYRIVSGQLEEAVELGCEQVAVAEHAGDRGLILEAECEVANALVFLGRFAQAMPRHERVLALYEPERHHHDHVLMFGRDPGMSAHIHRALARASAGDRAAAWRSVAAATSLVQRWPHPFSEAWCRVDAAFVAHLLDDRAAMIEHAQTALTLSIVEGFPNWEAQASVLLGWARAAGGRVAEGLELARRGVEGWERGGAVLARAELLGLLADTLRMAGQIEEGIAAIDAAIDWAECGDRWYEPELHRWRAELLCAHGDREDALLAAAGAIRFATDRGAAGFLPRAQATLRRMSDRSGVR
jgi:class 3 adenylate cyclase/tetratricopeptide (TPR) repeat protein